VNSSPLPDTIRKRDGRVVPFEPDKLSRSLFAATEALGAPDPFLARELTDSVVHFLSGELAGAHEPPSSRQLAELTVKVVRELGYPALAKIYADSVQRQQQTAKVPIPIEWLDWREWEQIPLTSDPLTVLSEAGKAVLSGISLSQVYPRDLILAHREGLLQLLDLDIPQEMVGMVLSPNQPPALDGWGLVHDLVRARGLAGSFVAFDGPEHAIAVQEGIPEEMALRFLEILDRSLWLSHLYGILNLNSAEAPSWAAPLTLGPLFEEFQKEMEGERLDRIARYLLRHARKQSIYWHLSEADFSVQNAARLAEIIGRALARDHVEFVFDRPGKPVALGPGIDRDRTAALGMVGVNLPRFVDQLGGGPLDSRIYLKKLASLARFAKSAGHARQDYLRKTGRPQLREGFLLERAILIVHPAGAVEAARKVLGTADLSAIGELARQSLETIRLTLETDQPRTMATRLDSPPAPSENRSEGEVESSLLPRQQLKLGAALCSAAGGGCLTIFLKGSDSADVNQLADLLHSCWRGDVMRLRFVRRD